MIRALPGRLRVPGGMLALLLIMEGGTGWNL